MGSSSKNGPGPKDPEPKRVSQPAAERSDNVSHPPELEGLTPKKKKCLLIFGKVAYIVLAVVTILISIVEIAVVTLAAITNRMFSTDMTGRLVAMIVLAITAAVTLSALISAVVGLFKKKSLPIYIAAAILGAMLIIQALIAGISVRVTLKDEEALGASLMESFLAAREDNIRHVKMWDTTQTTLGCCGVYSPEDYRTPRLPAIFPPDVPVSCCPSYEPHRSDLVQERTREQCRARKQYYGVGCKVPVLTVFKESATIVLGVTITLIILELVLALLSGLVVVKYLLNDGKPDPHEPKN